MSLVTLGARCGQALVGLASRNVPRVARAGALTTTAPLAGATAVQPARLALGGAAHRTLWSSPTARSPPPQEKLADFDPQEAAHTWRQQNHIWSEPELVHVMENADLKHRPKTLTDKAAHTFMRTLYHSFNFVTGYREENPSAKAMEWRLIVLESFAGVPGFIAAGFRHFYSLRRLERDHGFIYTFLEEAENERMHLLVRVDLAFSVVPSPPALLKLRSTRGELLMHTLTSSSYFVFSVDPLRCRCA